MNSDNDSAGWALVQAWKAASVELLIEYSSVTREPRGVFRGKIVRIEPGSLIAFSSPDEDVAVDMRGASFVHVGSREIFKALGLDPSKYVEMVEIAAPELNRLVVSVAPSI